MLKDYPGHFPAQSQKTPKQIHLEKNWNRKWNFPALVFKKFLYFLKRKVFLYFLKWNPALFTRSSKNKRNPPGKISYTSGKGNPEKISYIFPKESYSYVSGNGSPDSKLQSLAMFGILNYIFK